MVSERCARRGGGGVVRCVCGEGEVWKDSVWGGTVSEVPSDEQRVGGYSVGGYSVGGYSVGGYSVGGYSEPATDFGAGF